VLNLHNDLANRISAKATAAAEGSPLSIAVLGPSLGSGEANLGGQKRKEIRDALQKDGHHPFFPEDVVTSDPSGPTLLEQERVTLGDPGVDLIIILYTLTSYGVLQEIANFVSYPDIKAKAAVLYPFELWQPGESLFSDTLSEYLVRSAYAEAQFDNCTLVFECRKWANLRATGQWAMFEAHRF
jgi:hypothetical protein